MGDRLGLAKVGADRRGKGEREVVGGTIGTGCDSLVGFGRPAGGLGDGHKAHKREGGLAKVLPRGGASEFTPADERRGLRRSASVLAVPLLEAWEQLLKGL